MPLVTAANEILAPMVQDYIFVCFLFCFFKYVLTLICTTVRCLFVFVFCNVESSKSKSSYELLPESCICHLVDFLLI